jgi:hypothetical protein
MKSRQSARKPESSSKSVTTTPQLLNADDRCRRLPYLAERWQPPAIHPTEALYEAIEAGLTSPAEKPWDTAEQALYDLATTRGLDSAQSDLLGEAEHLAALASFIAYLLRPDGPWKRPEAISLPDGSLWHPASFLNPSETHLRRLVLCSRWDAYRQVEAEHDWRTLEGSIYAVPMDLVIIVLGQQRDGRRHGPLSKGWTHPVSKQLRFRRRDGTGFDGNWQQVWREKSDFSKEAWLDALVEDGLLPETVLIHTVQPEQVNERVALAASKLSRIAASVDPPEPQLSRCFNRISPCPFRAACPRGEEPSESLGFLPLHHIADVSA